MSDKDLKKSIDRVFQKIEKMPRAEFMKQLNKHANGDIARWLREMGAELIPSKMEPIKFNYKKLFEIRTELSKLIGRDFTRKRFAKEVGVDQSLVTRWERGERSLSMDSFIKVMEVCREYGVGILPNDFFQ